MGCKRRRYYSCRANLVHPESEDYKNGNFEIPIITIAKDEVGNVATQSVVALAIAAYMSKCIDLDVLKETMLHMVPAKLVMQMLKLLIWV